MNPAEVEHILANCEFFKELDIDHIKKISGLCRKVTRETGEYLFQQNNFGEELFIIADGFVSLERSINLGHKKGNVVIESLGKGRVTGCWASLLDQPHHLMSSACCEKPTTVLVLNGSELRKMMLENTKLGFFILERFCFLLKDRIQAAYGAMERI
jgi:CRP/FNR family cyclic AMP-dependent transcriptional regulator